MLAPSDVAATQDALGASAAAAQTITQSSAAVTTLVPAYFAALTGRWAPLQTMLAGVVTDAQLWPDTFCGAYTQNIPALFPSFSSTFSQTSSRLQNDITALTRNPGDSGARQALAGGLQQLLTRLQELGAPLTDLQTRLVAYESTLQSDADAVQKAVADLEAFTPNGATNIISAQASLNANFLKTTALGPCNAIVEVDFAISTNLTTTLDNQPQAIPVVLTQALLQQLLTSNGSAQAAMSLVLDTWTALAGRYAAVIHDVQNAGEQQLGGILQQLDVTVAQTAWRQLAAFVQTLSTGLSGEPHAQHDDTSDVSGFHRQSVGLLPG